MFQSIHFQGAKVVSFKVMKLLQNFYQTCAAKEIIQNKSVDCMHQGRLVYGTDGRILPGVAEKRM